MNIKIKILITTLFILMFCNTSIAYTETYEWETEPSYSDNYDFTEGTSGYYQGMNIIWSNDISSINGLYFISASFDTNRGEGFTKSSEYWNCNFIIDGQTRGTGIAGYSKGSQRTFFNYWIQSEGGLDTSSFSGGKEIIVSNIPNKDTLKVFYAHKYPDHNEPPYAVIPRLYFNNYAWYAGGKMDIHYYTRNYFINTININDNGEIIHLEILRNEGNKSKCFITDPFELLKETSLKYNIIDLTSTNNSINIQSENFYEEILDYTYTREEAPGISTLTTDKTYYNTSEIIEISFTDIDTIYNECDEHICEKPYELHILYPVSDPYKQYGTKFIYPLTYNLEDETIFLNTSFLHPENTYILGIVGINGYYGLHDDILIFSDSFTVYPDDEYLSVSCDAESGCYTYNNADITIYYQINNNSDIIIKDNNNNIINTYHNIIDNGEILYHIPDDLYHENTYPNWKIYLNNTEYSTSFNKGVTVYWSQFQTPTPTPTFTPQPTPDINISDTIDEFKTETQPIKDLIFGLSEIVIDNPDYNKDNIVDESEINHWFNSLIPLCIIFLLIVLYIGLKKQRE